MCKRATDGVTVHAWGHAPAWERGRPALVASPRASCPRSQETCERVPDGRVREGWALSGKLLAPARNRGYHDVCTMTNSNVNIGCWSRGVGKPGFPTPPPAGGPGPHTGEWGKRVSPFPYPREGLGGLCPPRNNRMFIAALCAMRMTVSREHRLLEQGCGETWFPHAPAGGRARPSRRGMGKAGFPIPPPAGGFGRAVPSQEQPYVHGGVVRRSRMDGCCAREDLGAIPLTVACRRGGVEGLRPSTDQSTGCGRRGREKGDAGRRSLSAPLHHVLSTKRMWRFSPPPSLPPPGGGARFHPPAGERAVRHETVP